MKKYLFFCVVTLQLLVIIFLAFKIYGQSRRILGVNVIKQENIVKNVNSKFKYFYEPPAGTNQIINLDWLPEKAVYTINNDSLNERIEYLKEKSKETFRIIVLGDSFAFGQNVSTKYNWVEILEDKLNKEKQCLNKIKKYEVINLGVYGYDIQYAVERFRLRGIKYNPDLVIWVFSDFERILEIMLPLIEKYDTSENRALEKQGIFYQNWHLARQEMLSELTQQDLIEFQKKAINKLNFYFNGNLIYLSFPNKNEYLTILKELAFKRPNTYFFQPTFTYSNKEFFLPDSHLNNLGHKQTAQDVYGYLIKNKLVPCH